MGARKDAALVKRGVWILILCCTLGVSMAAQAANKALGEPAITLLDLQRKNQIMNISFMGWRTDLDLRQTRVIKKKYNEVLTASLQRWERNKPILAQKIKSEMKVWRHKLTKQRETALSLFKNTMDQLEQKDLEP